jgi:hypothetical protein
MQKKSVHFVGFRGEEFWSAVKVFGRPDFVHKWHDHRMWGDVGEGDTIVFARAKDETVSQWTWQDHELW